MVTDINILDLNKTYSYADYLTWEFPERVELYKGRVCIMEHAPIFSHQRVAVKLHGRLFNYFEQSDCNLFFAPFDVRLLDKNNSKNDKDIYTVVQPDLCVICDENKIDERGCIGAPDLVIEVLSPGNVNSDLKYKFDLYEEAGVREYWLVHPTDRDIQIFVLKDDKFIGMHPLIDEDNIQSRIFPELDFKLEDIFK